MDLPEQYHPLSLGVAALLPGEFYAVISKHGLRPVAPWKENSATATVENSGRRR
jgi:hypothetical protein